jgi:hypothetical protein
MKQVRIRKQKFISKYESIDFLMQTPKLVSSDFLKEHLSREVLIEIGNLCPDCLEPLVNVPDGAHICKKCGAEFWNGGQIEERISFSEVGEEGSEGRTFEGHHQPVNQLTFGKNLGCAEWIPTRAYTRILACKDPKRNFDIGLRSKQMRILNMQNEHPWIVRMLSVGSQLCKDFQLNNGTELSISFANLLGRELRRLGSWLIIRKDRDLNFTTYTKLVFVVLLKKYQPAKFQDTVRKLKIDGDQLWYVEKVLAALSR